jgi:dihydrofolate reductase
MRDETAAREVGRAAVQLLDRRGNAMATGTIPSANSQVRGEICGGGLEATCSLGERVSAMGLLTFGLNVTLDGCCDHREGVANDEMLRYWTRVMDAAGAMLFGRRTYELMEDAWPQVARDPKATPANRDWARKLEAKPKYVVSTTRRDFPWSNTHHVEGDLKRAVKALKKATPRGLLVGSPKLSAALQRLDLVDEYRFVVHPVVAGHGPYLFSGLQPSLRLKFVAATRLKSGIVALHYRRR